MIHYPGEDHSCLTAGQMRTLDRARRSERWFGIKEKLADWAVVTVIVGLLAFGLVFLVLSVV